ncbi:TetR/AcrR family transcriptional regulator [Streptomyces sp. NPDC020489]|uniref:TetR/AcrR family transcriptional regulator n=1 Tax=Streptomyces sp. NPDC020489 TaxID=3365077 RepID=UPI0037B9ACA4
MYAEKTRADLEATARELFVDNGFAGMSVEAVTGATLVSSTFSHHYPDRKAMFAELCTEFIQQVGALADARPEAVRTTLGTPATTAVAHLQTDVPVDTVARLLLAGLCEGNQTFAPPRIGKMPWPGRSV